MIFQPTEILVRDQQTIQLVFSSRPSMFLSRNNFSIISTFSGVNDLNILSIDINDFTITLNTRPMFAQNLYLINLLNIDTQPFEDENNIELSTLTDARQIYFVGVEDINTVRDKMLQNLPSNYDTGEQTLVRDATTIMANEISIAGITLEEIKNDNFISVNVVDELYYRGPGPTERLKNEGAYEILRVARTITGTNAAGSKTFDPITNPNILFDVINLRAMKVVETVPNDLSINNFNGFLITVNKQFVTSLLSVVLTPGNYFYDPTLYGYALLNNNYDRLASKSVALKNNQILLSALTGVFPEPIPGDSLKVTYEYDSIGRRVDGSSIILFTVLKQKNETILSSISNFFLDFANIVSSDGRIINYAGITFNISTINLNTHPAFIHELIFNTDSLPSIPGDYTINYTTGQVFVFGTQTEIGTGTTPPVASYYYQDIAVKNTDYYVSDDGYNIRLNSFSKFATQQFTINFLYEDIFTPGIDYAVSSHIEVLDERINNRLVSDFTIQTNNGPVKDIYQILNETTGESYTPGLIENNQVSFAGNTPPHTSTTLGELANVAVVDDEILDVLIPTLTPNGLIKVFPIALKNHPVMNQRQDGIGSNFSTSIQLTRLDLFLNEFYFNPFESIQLNLEKIKNIGDYLVDYATSNMYLAVSSIQSFDIGHISYSYGSFIPNNKHVLAVSNIGLGTTSTHIIQEFAVEKIEDGIIIPAGLNYGYDSFDGQTRIPNSASIFIAQLQDDFTVYTKYPIKKVYSVFTQNDIDGYNAITIATKNLFNSSVNSFGNTKIDLKTYIILSAQTDANPDYLSVIIPDDTTVVKSIIVIDTNTQLLDTQLYLIKYKNIIIKTVVGSPSINPTSATITIQNIISLNNNDISDELDSFVDIADNRFLITSLTGGNILTVNITDFVLPIVNSGSQILDSNGILVANHLNIISVTELPDLQYIIHYDVFPAGILIGYQVKDAANNVFTITDVQVSSVIVSILNLTIPIVDPVAKIETSSLLVSIGSGQTKLYLPIDTPIVVGSNLQIGYVPDVINNRIIAANQITNSAGGAGMLIDYSVGQFFIDYSHLDDELLISYDWGDNQLDWSIGDTLQQNDPYFVSYKYGASRNGLETNFGVLTNVDFLQSAPLSISRETYRTAVGAAIKAFLKGPTHEAVRLLAHAFTQQDPDIEEAILNQWIVGRDPLSLQQPIMTGGVVFGNGKYNEGLVISDNNSIQLPGDSSMRLSQGTFSTWFRPNWGGSQADANISFNLPLIFSVYYNAHDILPQDVLNNPWQLEVSSNLYGTAFTTIDYLEIRNSKNNYTTDSVPNNDNSSSYLTPNGIDGYVFSSTLGLHSGLTDFSYASHIGKYFWQREETTLSLVNDLTINFAAYVNELNYVNPAINNIQVANVLIDDGYGAYGMGFYLVKKNLYTASVILEDVHLSIEKPFINSNPPIFVSTTIGLSTVNVISGDTSSLSIGQQITIGSAYPELTNIIGFTSTTIIMRSDALTNLIDYPIGRLDPISHLGMYDGYGETQLQDKLGTRQLVSDLRQNGWERQLLVKLSITPYASGHLMILGEQPLTTQTPVIDFLDSLVPGFDIFVDGYGNAFELDSVELPYIWLKKPSASGVSLPIGIITAFRKVSGVKLPDNTFISMPSNWSNSTKLELSKISGKVTLTVNTNFVSSSYVQHYATNSSGTSSISFGQVDLNNDATIRVQNVYYDIHSIFDLTDVYVGNTGSHPLNENIDFKYDMNTTGIPAINKNKYLAIFTNKASTAIDEPIDEVFVKMKIPSTWTLSDDTGSQVFPAIPIVSFSANTIGDFINITDAYGMTYSKTSNDTINLIAIDTSTYISGHNSILLDGGPELRIAAGKRHYLFDAETNEGSLRLYRSGDGFIVVEVQADFIYNIRADISNWLAGSIHHIATSWKIDSPDEIDELHLFIDGDEAPNEITFGSDMPNADFGSVYEEVLTVVPRQVSVDGYIVNNSNGSGLFIPNTAFVQPDSSWINKTIVLNATMLGPNTFLNEPLIVGALVSVAGGEMLFLSQNNEQINFSMYGSSVPVLYGLATNAIAKTTILVRANFGIFKNDVELNGPATLLPQFRQINNSQIIEFYNTDPTTGEYVENVSINDVITIKTYGLLIQRVKETVYQYGSLIRTVPIEVYINAAETASIVVNSGGPAFITDLPPPIDPTQVVAVKILLPRVTI